MFVVVYAHQKSVQKHERRFCDAEWRLRSYNLYHHMNQWISIPLMFAFKITWSENQAHYKSHFNIIKWCSFMSIWSFVRLTKNFLISVWWIILNIMCWNSIGYRGFSSCMSNLIDWLYAIFNHSFFCTHNFDLHPVNKSFYKVNLNTTLNQNYIQQKGSFYVKRQI